MATPDVPADADPVAVLRGLLRLSPDDAAKARQKARDAMQSRCKSESDDDAMPRGQYGPTGDYGES